jgi:hypothetical protein
MQAARNARLPLLPVLSVDPSSTVYIDETLYFQRFPSLQLLKSLDQNMDPLPLGKASLRQSHAEAIAELAAKALLDENIPLVEIQWRCGYPGFLRQTELSSRIDLHLKYGEPNRLYLGRH